MQDGEVNTDIVIRRESFYEDMDISAEATVTRGASYLKIC